MISSRDLLSADMLIAPLKVEGDASFVDHNGESLGHICTILFSFGLSIQQTIDEYRVDLMRRNHDRRTVLHGAVMFGTLTEKTLKSLVNVIGMKADEQASHGRSALPYTIEAVANKTRRYAWHSRSGEGTRDVYLNFHGIHLNEPDVNVLTLRAV